jgi:hypothetical protein
MLTEIDQVSGYCRSIVDPCTWARTARVEKDWTRTQRQLRMTADFCPLYFNDCIALLGLITMEQVIRSGQFFLIYGQGHILNNSIFCLQLKMLLV